MYNSTGQIESSRTTPTCGEPMDKSYMQLIRYPPMATQKVVAVLKLS